MAVDKVFARAVEDGLKLAKRVYAGKDRQFAVPPRPAAGMERSSEPFLPTAPMVYAVISDPAIVDNPDIPSYQPHVYGACDPPALIPLHMGDVGLEVECLLDTAFVAVRGRWRVHCVMRNKSCDCRLVVPMGEQVRKFGSFLPRFRWRFLLLVYDSIKSCFLNLKLQKIASWAGIAFVIPGVEVEVDGRSYYTQVIELEDYIMENTAKIEGGGLLKPQISVNGIFLFFYQEKSRQAGKLTFLYEADVESWSNKDFDFSFSVSSNFLGFIIL
ncbi:hypothetical protein GW17_00055830 [Ensete ventricosum]|nr:hypothetical protein GW17_00055830 [Ensete ventricosum]